MTAQDIADQSGVPLSTVNNFFANASKSPSINTAGPICAVLGISLDEFFGIGNHYTATEETLQAEKVGLEKRLSNKTADHYDDGAGRPYPEPDHSRPVGAPVPGHLVRPISGLSLRPARLLAGVTHGTIPEILRPA